VAAQEGEGRFHLPSAGREQQRSPRPSSGGAAARAMDEVDEEGASAVEEPQDYWEKEEVANQIAKFDHGPKGDDIPMLVAVRVRPLWDKEIEAGDYGTVRVLENKVVVVLDPWYDADLNPNRAKEKKYAFDVVFPEGTG